jgi:ribosomal protein RSM22 (predicted rRNA methylase)
LYDDAMSGSEVRRHDDLKRVAEKVAELSRLLTKDRERLPAAYLKNRELRNAYLQYFLPANINKVHQALADLALHPAGLLSRERLLVLDVGAGPGTALLGLLAYFAGKMQRPSLSCVALDRVGENLHIAEDLFNEYRLSSGLDASLVTVVSDIENPRRLNHGPFDLILFSNVLNELFPEHEDRIMRRAHLVGSMLRENLSADGSCIIIEPALRETSRGLLEVRDRLLEQGLFVFSPCPTGTACPALLHPRDWCHEEIPWDPPESIKAIDRLTGLRKDALKFSYLVVRRDNRSLSELFGPDSFRVVSEPLITKGKIEFFVCGLPGRKLITRLDRDRSPMNGNFDTLKRGAIVSFNGLRDEGTRYKVEQQTHVLIHKQ